MEVLSIFKCFTFLKIFLKLFLKYQELYLTASAEGWSHDQCLSTGHVVSGEV